MKAATFLKIFGTATAGLGLFLLIGVIDETQPLVGQALKAFLTMKAFGFAFLYIGSKALTAAFDKEEAEDNN